MRSTSPRKCKLNVRTRLILIACASFLSFAQISFCLLRPEAPLQGKPDTTEPDEFQGAAFPHDAVGEYLLPRPWFLSPLSPQELWEGLGVNIRCSGEQDDARRAVVPQPATHYRTCDAHDEAALRDMTGAHVPSSRNPGIRVEPDFISEQEEEVLVNELQDLATGMGLADASNNEHMLWRMTGRMEGQPEEVLAPWGYGPDFDAGELPPTLVKIVDRIKGIKGYSLGPLRDITVNSRQTATFQMSPHVDPPPDGANTFVLSLLSGAVITFSPVEALRSNAERANNLTHVIRHSFTDDDLDCLAQRRSLWHAARKARYLWTHAIRPSVSRNGETDLTTVSHDGETDLTTYEWWGTWDTVVRREEERMSIIFSFADPLDEHDGFVSPDKVWPQAAYATPPSCILGI